MDSEIVLGYWPIRGLGQVPRLLLTYTKTTWKDKLYTDRNEWFNKDKKTMSLAFPNLPYLLEGHLKISESMAINRYIINRSGCRDLLGKDIKDQALVDNLLGVFADIRAVYAPLFFSENYAEDVKGAPAKMEKKLGLCQGFYGDKDFALGYLTLPDFIFAENAYYIREISEELYNKYPFLDRVRKAVEALPEVKAYYEREGAIK